MSTEENKHYAAYVCLDELALTPVLRRFFLSRISGVPFLFFSEALLQAVGYGRAGGFLIVHRSKRH